ncbi:MAG: S-layer homology domain-containing protein [Fimbriimonadaceae bacterium]|nr:S-layer homology domain-containing protein [Fimbriimonadaceae bacterium]
MNRTLRVALGLVLGAALAVPGWAQSDAFPDTPKNHWAYEALAAMKANGLLVGYPDGLWGGDRPTSRYEMAVAVHAAYKRLKEMMDRVDGQINDIKMLTDRDTSFGGDQVTLVSPKRALEDLRAQVAKMGAWGDDVARLHKLAQTFEKELASLGVDVAAMQQGLGSLDKRVGDLEKQSLPVNIGGDLTFAAYGGYSQDGLYGLTVDSRPVGIGHGSYNGLPSGATRDLSVFHEAALTLSSRDDSPTQWRTTFVTGNALEGFGDQAWVVPGAPLNYAPENEFYLSEAWLKFDTSLMGRDLSASVGRVNYRVGPYLFQRVDNTPYFSNERWDNRAWTLDGAIVGLEFGGARLDVFGGRTSTGISGDGTVLQPMFAGNFTGPGYAPGGPRPRGMNSGLDVLVDRSLGANLVVPIASLGTLNLAYLWLDGDTVSTASAGLVNGVNVYGGDLNLRLGEVRLEGGYSQSDVRYNETPVVNEDNRAWYVNAGLSGSRWGVKGFYKAIDPLFAAPGDWGRIGDWWNPTDIRGYGVNAHFDFSDRVSILGSAERYQGAGTARSALTSDDELHRYLLGVGYQLNRNWQFGLGYEHVEWSLGNVGGAGKPTERWWNIGFGYAMDSRTTVNILWQISDFDGKGAAGFQPFGTTGDRAKGGLITTQLSVKF